MRRYAFTAKKTLTVRLDRPDDNDPIAFVRFNRSTLPAPFVLACERANLRGNHEPIPATKFWSRWDVIATDGGFVGRVSNCVRNNDALLRELTEAGYHVYDQHGTPVEPESPAAEHKNTDADETVVRYLTRMGSRLLSPRILGEFRSPFTRGAQVASILEREGLNAKRQVGTPDPVTFPVKAFAVSDVRGHLGTLRLRESNDDNISVICTALIRRGFVVQPVKEKVPVVIHNESVPVLKTVAYAAEEGQRLARVRLMFSKLDDMRDIRSAVANNPDFEPYVSIASSPHRATVNRHGALNLIEDSIAEQEAALRAEGFDPGPPQTDEGVL